MVNAAALSTVIPAKAGIHLPISHKPKPRELDSCLRRNDEYKRYSYLFARHPEFVSRSVSLRKTRHQEAQWMLTPRLRGAGKLSMTD